MLSLSLVFGAVVGFSLGLTGGGGSIFAVPLLVYGLSIDPRQAVGISLASVGITSAVGFVGRYRAGEVEIATGLMFSLAGMIGAPFGSWLSVRIPRPTLLTLFALLMLVVAVRMWRKAGDSNQSKACSADDIKGATCNRDAEGKLHLTSPCAALLSVVGVLTGIFSGLFGVGGGFVIVPALVVFSGLSIHRAIGTSLLAIALISASGVASHLLASREIPLDTTLLFAGGGVLGMFAGLRASRFMSGPALQKVFATAIVGVALFIIFRSIL